LCLTIEDHYAEGGIGEAVSFALSDQEFKIYHVHVNSIPRSGKPEELLDLYGLSAVKIEGTIKKLLGK